MARIMIFLMASIEFKSNKSSRSAEFHILEFGINNLATLNGVELMD